MSFPSRGAKNQVIRVTLSNPTECNGADNGIASNEHEISDSLRVELFLARNDVHEPNADLPAGVLPISEQHDIMDLISCAFKGITEAEGDRTVDKQINVLCHSMSAFHRFMDAHITIVHMWVNDETILEMQQLSSFPVLDNQNMDSPINDTAGNLWRCYKVLYTR